MSVTSSVWRVLLCAALASLAAFVSAGEAPKAEPKPGGAGEVGAAPEAEDTTTPEIVAKIGKTAITRRELASHRRQLAFAVRAGTPLPNNQVLLEQLVNRTLWQQYFADKHLMPAPTDVTGAIQGFDRDLRQRGSSYEQFLTARGLSAEEHASMIAYELAMRRLISDIQKEIPDKSVQAEFDAHPEIYDGSRVKISQIFIDTSKLRNDPAELKKAKERIDGIFKKLQGGKKFDQLASDESEGVAASQGGALGWVQRKVNDDIEPLVAAAWKLKPNEYTMPIQGTNGWHILMVTEREPAYYTFFGAKRAVEQELIRKRLESMLDELKGKTKIEKFI